MSHEKRDYVGILRRSGYRVTPQRLVVLDAVCDVGRHATFRAIFQRARELEAGINQATVYRALDVLCDVGLVVSAHEENQGKVGKVYEVCDSGPHHHLVCRECGQKYTLDESHLASLASDIYREFGFKIESKHLILSGICKNCHPLSQ